MISFACKPFLICAYFTPGFEDVTFFTGESNIMDRGLSQKQRLEVKNILIMDLVLKNMELFTSQDVN